MFACFPKKYLDWSPNTIFHLIFHPIGLRRQSSDNIKLLLWSVASTNKSASVRSFLGFRTSMLSSSDFLELCLTSQWNANFSHDNLCIIHNSYLSWRKLSLIVKILELLATSIGGLLNWKFTALLRCVLSAWLFNIYAEEIFKKALDIATKMKWRTYTMVE